MSYILNATTWRWLIENNIWSIAHVQVPFFFLLWFPDYVFVISTGIYMWESLELLTFTCLRQYPVLHANVILREKCDNSLLLDPLTGFLGMVLAYVYLKQCRIPAIREGKPVPTYTDLYRLFTLITPFFLLDLFRYVSFYVFFLVYMYSLLCYYTHRNVVPRSLVTLYFTHLLLTAVCYVITVQVSVAIAVIVATIVEIIVLQYSPTYRCFLRDNCFPVLWQKIRAPAGGMNTKRTHHPYRVFTKEAPIELNPYAYL